MSCVFDGSGGKANVPNENRYRVCVDASHILAEHSFQRFLPSA